MERDFKAYQIQKYFKYILLIKYYIYFNYYQSLLENEKASHSDKVIYEKPDENEHAESVIGNTTLFQGREYESETGLYYFRARYFHPKLGRFLQPDPKGYVDSTNLYQSFNQNPVNYTDPMGEDSFRHKYVGASQEEKEKLIREMVERAKGIQPVEWNLNSLLEGIGLKGPIQQLTRLVRGEFKEFGKIGLENLENQLDDPMGLAIAFSGGVKFKGPKLNLKPRIKSVRHATQSPFAAQSIINRINPKFFNPKTRFGSGFYVTGKGGTAVAEVVSSGGKVTNVIRFEMNLSGQNVLYLNKPSVAQKWGYSSKLSYKKTQLIAKKAQMEGYNAIVFRSTKGSGLNYAIFTNFDKILKPLMVTPVK